MKADKKVYAVLFFLCALFSFSAFSEEVLKSVRKGNIFLEYSDYTGSVIPYYENSAGVKTPVIDTVDYATSSFIGILVDNRYYNLKTSGGSKYTYSADENSMTVSYSAGKAVGVDVVYTVKADNILSITYRVKNYDSKEHSISVKSIFDTAIAEMKNGGFSTAVKQDIDSEYIISDLKRHSYLACSDGKIGIRFILDDAVLNSVYKVVVAAKPFFSSSVFEGQFSEGRSFNTILSYNNSCVGFFFRMIQLKAMERKEFVQTIQFVSGPLESAAPPVYEAEESAQLPWQQPEEKPAEEIPSETSPAGQPSVPFETEFIDENEIDESNERDEIDENKTEEIKETPVSEPPALEKLIPETGADSPAFETSSETETEAERAEREMFSRQARELIQKIHELDDSGKNVSKTEVLKLQLELDRVLEHLKSGQ